MIRILGLFEHRPRRPALCLSERGRQRECKAFLLLRAEEARDRELAPVRNQDQPLDAEFLVLVALKPHPDRVHAPLPNAAVVVHLAHGELGRRYGHLLVGGCGAVIDPEGPVDQEHIEAQKSEHRPGAREQEHHSGNEAHAAEHQHEDQEARRPERTVRGEHGRKDGGFRSGVVVLVHAPQYRGRMARKTPRKTAKKGPRATVRRALKKARAGRAARVKAPKTLAAADRKAAAGEMPQWTTAEIEEAFRRFSAANPAPLGELEHVDPYTLLIAVVLSAQATDAGVNKATPALFAAADTPAKMVALGEARVRDLIKTIGLYRTKAKNVIALSKRLVEDYGGEVPPSREALESLPGVGRKTANVVLNVAFGEPTIAVDTHIFRVGNRTGLAPGKTPYDVEMKLLDV